MRQRTTKAAIKRIDKTLKKVEVATALELYAPDDDRFTDLAKLLRSNDVTVRTCHISTLARRVNLPYREVVMAFRDYKRLEGIVAVAERVPTILEGIAQDAEPSETICLSCGGEGRIPTALNEDDVVMETKPCIPCNATGKVRKPGDPLARKQVLEMMELAGPRATPVVTNSQVLITSGSLEETLRSAGRGGGNNGLYRDASRPQADEPPAGTPDTIIGENPA